MPKPRGRPPRADRDDVISAFLDGVADGLTTRRACSQANVPWRTICGWLTQDPEFAARYARAREDAGHMWADKAVSILDDLPDEATKEQIQTARARADIYKWRAVVQGRRDYGEKQQVDVTSGGEPLVVQFVHEGARRTAG